MRPILDRVYFNNTVLDYLIAVGVIVLGSITLLIIRRTLFKVLATLAGRTEGKVDDIIVRNINRYGVAALQFAIIYWGVNYLQLSERVHKVVDTVTAIAVTYFFIRLISAVILIMLQNYVRRQERGEDKIKQLGGLMMIINVMIWVLGIVFFLDNQGKDVTTIITGLGIGGIAIALAAQNILGDLFNYFVIYFDRPFEAGDFIIVDDKMGTVEYVGIKTTRVRSLGGEQIIIGNSNITGARIHNFKRLLERRIAFSFNIEYNTSIEKIRMIPGIVRTIIERQKTVRFDRAHFAGYGDWALRFEVVYIFLDPDFNKYMDTQQEINLAIYEELRKMQVRFATSVPQSVSFSQPGFASSPGPSESEKRKVEGRT